MQRKAGRRANRRRRNQRDTRSSRNFVGVTGVVENDRWVSRSGGRAGDELFVTGKLGGSIRGKHLRFVPRIAESRWLTKNFPIHAMMDLSDGLGADLPRLARASRLGFDIEENALPRNPGCTVAQAINDGEDYELLLRYPRARPGSYCRRDGRRISEASPHAHRPSYSSLVTRHSSLPWLCSFQTALKKPRGLGGPAAPPRFNLRDVPAHRRSRHRQNTIRERIRRGARQRGGGDKSHLHASARIHRGRLTVYHFDFYRLEDRAAALRLGLDDYFFGDGVSVIEWADRFRDLIPPQANWISFEMKSETARMITG